MTKRLKLLDVEHAQKEFAELGHLAGTFYHSILQVPHIELLFNLLLVMMLVDIHVLLERLTL